MENKEKEPILIIMAAGMGSRYGGLKQIDPVGSEGELIMDFSLYDAMMAGFKKVIFVIKKEHEEDFRSLIDDRAGRFLEVKYAFQELSDIPDGFQIPKERVKPWGTCHAVLSCREIIDGPFAVINADDYYGAGAFHAMYDFLAEGVDGKKYRYSMVGYLLEKTLTENGHVARGVCNTSKEGFLVDIAERTKIMHRECKIEYTEDEVNWNEIPKGTTVSMNFWGFTESMIWELKERFPRFLEETLKNNPLKGEFFLPLAVDSLINEGKAEVKVLTSKDKWHGVTYKEDKEGVVAALQSLKDKGLYPEKLWV